MINAFGITSNQTTSCLAVSNITRSVKGKVNYKVKIKEDVKVSRKEEEEAEKENTEETTEVLLLRARSMQAVTADAEVDQERAMKEYPRKHTRMKSSIICIAD